MKAKLLIIFLFLLSISTASAYIEPRDPYIVKSSIEGITENENGDVIITDNGCLFFVNTTFHYKYGFERIENILAVVKDPVGNSLDFANMILNQNTSKEGFATVRLELPGENRTAGKYTIRYTVEYYNALDSNELDKTFLTSTSTFTIEPIEEQIEEPIINLTLNENNSLPTTLQEEHELNIIDPTQEEIEIIEVDAPVQEKTNSSLITAGIIGFILLIVVLLSR